jgi:hypothetical protein
MFKFVQVVLQRSFYIESAVDCIVTILWCGETSIVQVHCNCLLCIAAVHCPVQPQYIKVVCCRCHVNLPQMKLNLLVICKLVCCEVIYWLTTDQNLLCFRIVTITF